MNLESKFVLSVIIPVYQVEDYIDVTLKSLVSAIGQRDDIEVIFINDGSRDRSVDIVRSYLDLFVHSVLLEQENAGLSATRNRGLSVATGEYIWFVDSDDVICEDAMCRFIGHQKNVNVDVISIEHGVIDSSAYSLQSTMPTDLPISGIDVLRSYVYLSPVMFYIYRRKFLIDTDLNFQPGIYHEDALFTVEVLLFAKSVIRLTGPFYMYRIRAGSIMTGGNNELHVAGMVAVVEKIQMHLEQFRNVKAARLGLSRALCKEVGGLCFYLRKIPREERVVIMRRLDFAGWYSSVGFNWYFFKIFLRTTGTYLKF